jgi:hypothetical protein
MLSSFLGTKSTSVKFELQDSLIDVINKVGKDMIFNENSALRSLPKYKQRTLKDLGTKSMSKSDAIKLLRERGYIKEICK